MVTLLWDGLHARIGFQGSNRLRRHRQGIRAIRPRAVSAISDLRLKVERTRRPGPGWASHAQRASRSQLSNNFTTAPGVVLYIDG